MGWEKFQDRLGFILIFLIPALWVSAHWIRLPDQVVGATILAFGLVVQFYFRKKAP